MNREQIEDWIEVLRNRRYVAQQTVDNIDDELEHLYQELESLPFEDDDE